MRSSPDLPIGSTFAGRFRIDQVLEASHATRRHVARDARSMTSVALETTTAAVGADFADIVARNMPAGSPPPRHPNVIAVIDHGHDAATSLGWIAMDLALGRTLLDVALRGEPHGAARDPGRVLTLMLGLIAGAEARAVAGARGVVLPHHVIVEGHPPAERVRVPLVIDWSAGYAGATFGFAPRAEDLGCIPPEVLENALNAMPTSQVYAAGAALLLLLTGAPPFAGTGRALMMRILHDPPDRPSLRRPGLPPALDGLILHALEKRPEDRPADLPTFATALCAILPVRGPS